jgi:predicted alternative tryptophan synthase beta-subunit
MKALMPGEKVPTSGIYRVSHLLPHTGEQREMYFEGSHFPPCRVCAGGVHYHLESPCVPMGVMPKMELTTAVC